MIAPAGVHLTTGWEPDLAPGDTLVRRGVLVHAAWARHAAQAAGRPWRATPGWSGGWVGARSGMAMLTQPLADARATVAGIAELFPAPIPVLLVSPWPTPDLRDLGLGLVGHPPFMVRLPDRAGTSHAAAPTDADLEVREVSDEEGVRTAERVLVEGYPMPEMDPLTPGDVLGSTILDGPTRIWLAWLRGDPVAVAVAHVDAGVTLVEHVAALPRARGHGAGTAVARTAALSMPENPSVLIASDDGRAVYERLGFVALERWTAWLRPSW